MTRGRLTGKSVAVAMGLILGLVTVGCEGSRSAVSPRPRVTTGLRGVALRELSCPARPKSPNRGAVAIGGVQEFLLCRSGLQGVARPPLIVTATEPQFTRLLTALSAPDAPPTTGACKVLSELEIVLLAKTPGGAFQVSIPLDGCGLYQAGAVEAVYGAPSNSAS